MATYFFSGINKPELLDILAQHHACGMVNALSAGQPKLRQAYASFHQRLALDSGACQGNRNVKGYARLIKECNSIMTFCSNLDVLHNQSQSDEHFRQLQYLLADDEQARTRLLWVYQCQSRGSCWHPQGDVDRLKRALERHSFIGIGGLVSLLGRNLIEAQDVLAALGAVLSEAGAQAHIFGLGSYSLLRWCITQSWFRSADSARWLHGFKSRMLLTRDGQIIRGNKLLLTRRQCAENNVRAIQEWMQPATGATSARLPSPSHPVPSVQLHWLDDAEHRWKVINN